MNPQFESDEFPGKPRILFIGGGDSSHTHSWIDLLEGQPFNVRLFSTAHTIPPAEWKVKTYVTAYNGPALNPDTRARLYDRSKINRLVDRTLARVGKRVRNGPDYSERWLAEIIRSWRPHLIHTLGLEPASYFYAHVRAANNLADFGKWIVTVRGGPDLALHRLLPEYESRIREVLTNCGKLIADNQLNYDYALANGLSQEQVSSLGIVPGTGGIDVEEIESRWHDLPSQRRIILWPKAYECPQSKALPVLEALRLAWHRLPPFELHMVAAYGEVRMWFQTLPPELRERCVVRERIPRAEILQLMTRARVMLAPTLSDGTPNSMFEAMAAGAVPIVSPLDTIRAVVEAEENVLFARNLYPEEIAAALVRSMTDDRLVDAIARTNLELVKRIADRNEIRAKVLNFYHSLVRTIG